MATSKSFSASRHLKRYGVWWVVLLFILVLASGFAAGYRVGPGFSIVKAGTLVLTNLPPSTAVYVDTKLRATVKDGGEYRTRLTPGLHTVIVDSFDRTPWQDGVDIRPAEESSYAPVLLAKKPDSTRLRDAAKTSALASIAAYKLPTVAAPLRAGCMDVYVAENRLIGKAVAGCEAPPSFLCDETGACTDPTVLLTPVEPLTSVVLYPGRTDTALFTVGDGVYVIDLDPRDPRFFVPFIRAVEPRLAPGTGSTVLLKDIDGLAYSFAL